MARIASVAVWGRIAGTIGLAALFATPLRAQDAAIHDLKEKISAAKMVQQTFAAGLSHCRELDGTNFYFTDRDRVLNLMDYRRSLTNLALSGSFNSETNKPWTQKDADARWVKAQQEAAQDKSNCELVTSLPVLQHELQALQQQTPVSK